MTEVVGIWSLSIIHLTNMRQFVFALFQSTGVRSRTPWRGGFRRLVSTRLSRGTSMGVAVEPGGGWGHGTGVVATCVGVGCGTEDPFVCMETFAWYPTNLYQLNFQFWNTFPVYISRVGELVAEWVAAVWSGLSAEHKNLFFMALWGLWFDINQLLFQKKTSSQGAVMEWISMHRRKFIQASVRHPAPTRAFYSEGAGVRRGLGE
ncbi:hypothetical protein ACS0TY_020463 [Phlomoides rotata]